MPVGAACGVRIVVDVICILMLKCVGRCLDSSVSKANKVAESSPGEKTRPSVVDDVVRMGLYWQGVYCGSQTLLLLLQLLRFCGGDC